MGGVLGGGQRDILHKKLAKNYGNYRFTFLLVIFKTLNRTRYMKITSIRIDGQGGV